jgi:hypothetical protein
MIKVEIGQDEFLLEWEPQPFTLIHQESQSTLTAQRGYAKHPGDARVAEAWVNGALIWNIPMKCHPWWGIGVESYPSADDTINGMLVVEQRKPTIFGVEQQGMLVTVEIGRWQHHELSLSLGAFIPDLIWCTLWMLLKR